MPYESTLERDWIISLDFDISVRSIHSQPFTVEYYDPKGRRRYYTPDILATYHEGAHLPPERVTEVKYYDDLKANWTTYAPKFKAARAYCFERGMKFGVVTERQIRTPLVKNATFLRRYREYPEDETIENSLMQAASFFNNREDRTPMTVLLAAFASEQNRLLAMGHLWKMLDAHAIRFDPMLPLNMESWLWLPESL